MIVSHHLEFEIEPQVLMMALQQEPEQ